MYVIKKVLIDSKEVEKTLFPKKYFFQVTVCVPGICLSMSCVLQVVVTFAIFIFTRPDFGDFFRTIQILGLLRNDGIILLDIDLLGDYINTTIMFSQMAHGRIKLIHRHREA